MSPEIGGLDRWRSDMPADEERLQELIDFVERRARSPDEVAIRAAYLDLLALKAGEHVLDVGCGTGVVTRELARRVAPDGRVVGVDSNPRLLEEAERLAAAEGLGGRIEWRSGDARKLDLQDESFDLVVGVTLLAHIPSSDPVVAELVRLVRPGGRMGILEIDPESMILTHPDHQLTRKVLNAANDYGFADAWASRRMPGLLQASGIRDLKVRAFTALERDPDGFLANAARLRPVVAERAGAITQEEKERWLAGLEDEIGSGRYLAGMSYIFAWGSKPA